MNQEWVEPRGPQLPAAVTRVPLGVWPFIALALLEAFGQWDQIRSLQIGHPVDAAEAVIGAIGGLAVPLIGAALFLRHPSAHRIMPAITLGVVLLAALTLVDALRDVVLEGIVQSDVDVETATLASTGYSIIQALIRVFAVTYIAIGLDDARQFEDRTGASGVRSLLLLAALLAPAITAFVVWPWPQEHVVTTLLSLAAQVATNLAWTYLAWIAVRGWAAGEQPHVAWGLTAIVAAGNVLVTMLAAVLNLVVWVIGPTESQVPAVFEVYRLLLGVLAVLWVLLLVAFWLGLPSEGGLEPDVEQVT
ncbi:MAG TPA: hypothetical protein VFU17_01175 [Candidatus Limnocylindrales bacterium]|nr:hypothetical protein [Candidatus Limnocylindrales bacterium]